MQIDAGKLGEKLGEKRWAVMPSAAARFESRTEGDQPILISGYGSVYYDPNVAGTEYRVDSDLVERLRPGCFDAYLASDRDCILAPYHDVTKILGRRSGMMTLTSDSAGLRYSCPYDAGDPDHVAIGAKLRRGDVSGSSTQFMTLSEQWIRDPDTDMIIREITEAIVFHLGPVVGEAYSSTTAEIRTASDGGWGLIQQRKAAFLASESDGYESLMLELDDLLLD